MLRAVGNIWRWAVRIEGVHAVATVVIAMIPVGIGTALAAIAQQQGWVVWLVALGSFSGFSAGRYYLAKYITDHGLAGHISIGFGRLFIDGKQKEGSESCKKRLNVTIHNAATYPIACSLHSKFTLDGRVTEDDDFDTPIFIGAKNARSVTTESIANVPKDASDWACTIKCRYGRSIDHLDREIRIKARNNGPSSYDIVSFEDTKC